jgi:L-alanine-DL-glutamate epimerase-like enolase superfamily enzyme
MKITDIRSMCLYGPLHHAVGGEASMIGKVIVRVDTDAGVYGLGEADDFQGVDDALTYIKHYLLGRDPLDVRPIVSELLYGTLPPFHPAARTGTMGERLVACPSMSPTGTAVGPIVWAASGVEMALCDLAGKALNTPVYTLLGGKFRDRVRIYLDRSAPADVANPDAWRNMARQVVEAGFTQMKFDAEYVAADHCRDVWNRSLSTEQINRTFERLNLVRETVGPDVELCLDCHMCFNVPDAVRLASALAPLNLLWLEDPTPIANPDSCAEVRRRSPIPICVGEMFTVETARLFIDHKACDIVHPDVMFCGGLHEARRIGDLAEVNHLPMAMHGNGGALATIAAAHVAAASRNFLGLEYHFIETPWIGALVRRELPLFADGELPLGDAPGLGVELDREVCRKYLAEGQTLLE